MENINTKNQQQNIDFEIEKIKAGSRRETYLFKHSYLALLKAMSEDRFPNISSSRTKDLEVMRWRYICNEYEWVESMLWQERAFALREAFERCEAKKEHEENSLDNGVLDNKIAELKEQYNMAKAEYYKIIGDYDRIVNERKTILGFDEIELSDVICDASKMLHCLAQLPEGHQKVLWDRYFGTAKSFGIEPSKQDEFSGSTFGE